MDADVRPPVPARAGGRRGHGRPLHGWWLGPVPAPVATATRLAPPLPRPASRPRRGVAAPSPSWRRLLIERLESATGIFGPQLISRHWRRTFMGRWSEHLPRPFLSIANSR